MKKKINLRELIWFGFNITCGITIFLAIPRLLNQNTADPNGKNLGLHMIWILVIEGILGLIISMAFVKLNQKCVSLDGGAYKYARTFYPKKNWLALLIAYAIYSILIMDITSQIVGLLRLNFGRYSSYPIHGKNDAFTNLYLDLMGLGIFAIGSFVVWKSYAFFKRTFIFSTLIKYTLTFLILAGAVTMAVVNAKNHQNVNLASRSSLPGFSQTIQLFLTIFYFFSGFEVYVVLVQNLQRPKRNLPIALCLVMGLVTVFYLLVILSFLGLFTNHQSNFSSNPAFNIFGSRHIHLQTAMNITAISAFIVSKLTAALQESFYANSILSPLAKDHFIPFQVNDERDYLSRRAVLLDFLVITSFFFCVVFVPDLIGGIKHTKQSPVNFLDIIEITSLFAAIIYLFVLVTNLFLDWKKQIRLTWFWRITFTLAIFFMSLEAIFYFIGIEEALLIGNYTKGGTILGFSVVIVVFYFGYYYFYLKPHLNQIKTNHPALFHQLETKYVAQFSAT